MMRQPALDERFMLALRGAAGTEWEARPGDLMDILVHSSGDSWTRKRPNGEWSRIETPVPIA